MDNTVTPKATELYSESDAPVGERKVANRLRDCAGELCNDFRNVVYTTNVREVAKTIVVLKSSKKSLFVATIDRQNLECDPPRNVGIMYGGKIFTKPLTFRQARDVCYWIMQWAEIVERWDRRQRDRLLVQNTTTP